jgi:hypothetical protein
MSAIDTAIQDQEFVQILFDTMSEQLPWDDGLIDAVVEELEPIQYDVDTGTLVERKNVLVRASDLHQVPRVHDQVKLSADPGMVDCGRYWTVSSVVPDHGMYQITFQANEGLGR